MFSTRRNILRGAAWGPLSGIWTAKMFAGARPKTTGVYEQLGIRPVINFRGTHTTIGASKVWPEIHEAMAEASRHYVDLKELQDAVGLRIAKLMGTPAAMVSTGAAGAITLGTCAALTGNETAKVRQLPELTGMKSEVIIQKAHRNGYDHAVRNTGVRIIDVETTDQFLNAAGPRTAMMYYLGGASHDWEWETPIPLEQCLQVAGKAGFPVMVDAANMLPPWDNITRLAALGVDLIALSGGKHIRGPQCSGILAGRKDLIDAAWLNSSPHSDSLGRPMKVGREEVVGLWLAVEKYALLDFDALERQSARQADYLIAEVGKIPGVTARRTPFDRTRRVHRVEVQWDEQSKGVTTDELVRQLGEGDPRIVLLKAKSQGVELTVFMNEPGDEKIAARRIGEIFAQSTRSNSG